MKNQNMNKNLIVFPIAIMTLITLSLFAKNYDNVKDTRKIDRNIDLAKHKTVNLLKEIDEKIVIYNYSGFEDSFEVYLYMSDDLDDEWILGCNTPLIKSKSDKRIQEKLNQNAKGKFNKNPPFPSFMSDTELELITDKELCKTVAIKARTNREYFYNCYEDDDNLVIEIYANPFDL